MEITRIKTINPHFMEAFNKLSDISLPVKDAINLVKSINVIIDESKNTHTVKNQIMVEFGIKSISLSGFEFDSTEKELAFVEEAFTSKWTELMDQTIEIPLKEKIKLPDNISISPKDLSILEDILEY